MAGAIAILRELHRLRRHAKGLQEEIERAPRLLRARQSALARQEEAIKQAHDELNKLKVTIRQDEGTLRQTHQQIAKYEKQLNEAASPKEYAALQHEIADARKKCGELEDAILESMAGAEEQTARIPQLEAALAEARREHAGYEETSRRRVAELTEELRRTQAALKEVEETLPEDIRPHYERLVNAMGEDAMSLVRDRTCSACHTSLTQQNYNDLLAGRLVTCKACGRIVYLPEEAAV
jgi:predicted  nucleic acid-binding Zn-ribbon protein